MNDQEQKLAIQELLASYATALNSVNAELIPSFYTKDGLFMPQGLKTRTVGDLAKTNPGNYLRESSFNIDYELKDVVVVDQYAFALAIAKVETTNLANGESTSETSRDFFVFRRDEHENWKIYRYIFNNVKKQSIKIMSTEANKILMKRFLQFINTADKALAAKLISTDAQFYVPGRKEPMRGPEGYLAIIEMMRSGFPDIQWTVDDLIVEEDKIAARFTMRGTHLGDFFGVPPTGRSIEVRAMNIYRFSEGCIIEEFGQPDMLDLLQQIGAVPIG